MAALNDEMEAEGLAGDLEERTREDRRRRTEVASCGRPYLLVGTCGRYSHAFICQGKPVRKGPV